MDTTYTQYTELADRLTAVADALATVSWDADSPCAGWSARDVVDHVITTQRDFLAQHDVKVGDLPDVAIDDDPAMVWREHAAAVADALARPGVAETSFDGFFGPTTVGATLARFYGFDMIVHRWDIGAAAGVATSFSPAEMEQIEQSIAGFGEHLYGDGICAPPVEMTGEPTRQERLLALLGRDPRSW